MATLTGKTIANTYKDLLQVSNENDGVDETMRTVSDGDGTNTALQLSNAGVNINGTFELNGEALTVNASAINNMADIGSATGIIAVNSGNVYGRTLTAGTPVSITNANGTAGNPTITLASIASVSGSYGPLTNFAVNDYGQIVSATAVSTSVSIPTIRATELVAETLTLSSNASIVGNLNVDGTFIVDGIVSAGSDVAVSGSLYVTSNVSVTGNLKSNFLYAVSASVDDLRTGTLSFNEVSVSTFTVNQLAIVSAATLAGVDLGTKITALETSIGTTNTLIAATSSALATSIGNSNTNITTNINAITSINTVLANTSSALATSIGTANTRITSVSDFAVSLSATMATSIANHLPLAGGTLSGSLSFSGANPNIIGGDTDGVFSITADTATDQGGNIKLYGNTHASKSQDIEFYGDSTVQLVYDDSASEWDFQANTVKTTTLAVSGNVSVTGNVSAAYYYGDGSNLTNLSTAPVSVSVYTVNQLTIVSAASLAGTDLGTKIVALETSIGNHLPLAGGTLTGALQANSTITVGVDDTGHDVKFFGDTASAYMLWDASTDDLILGGAAKLGVGETDPDTEIHAHSSSGGSALTLTGQSGYVNQVLFGSTANPTHGRVTYQWNTSNMNFATGNSSDAKMTIGSTEVVVNEPSNDIDFRVETDGVANMLFVDGGNNTVGVGISTVTSPNTMEIWANDTGTGGVLFVNQYGTGDPAIRFSTQATTYMVGIDNSDSDTFKIDYGTTGVGGQTGFSINTSGNVLIGTGTMDANHDLEIKRNGTVELGLRSADDGASMINFGQDSDRLRGRIYYTSGATEYMKFAVNGNSDRFQIGTSEVVANEDGNDIDFRVESDGNANMLFVDAGNNQVAVGTASPLTQFYVGQDNIGGDVAMGVFQTGNAYGNTASSATLYLGATYPTLPVAAAITSYHSRGATGNHVQDIAFLPVNTGSARFEAMRIDHAGYLGIGTATPTEKLTVSGNILTTGDVKLSDASSVNISTPTLSGANNTETGLTAQMLAGGAISAFDLVCIHTTNSEVVEADASTYATARAIGIAPAAISDTATGTILLQGFIRNDSWSWTPGSALYLSETAGAMTHTPPSTDGAFVQVVGVALNSDVAYFNPSMDVIERA